MQASRLYRLRRGTRLFSFDDPILEVPIVGSTLGAQQLRAARSVGAEIVDVESEEEIGDPRFVAFDEDLYFTPRFLRAALTAFESSPHGGQASVARSPFNDSVVLPTSDVPAKAWRLGLVCRDRRAVRPTEEVRIAQEIFPGHATGVPAQVVRDTDFRVDLSDCFAAPVTTPFHLLHVNVAVLMSRFVEGRRRWPSWLVERLAAPRSRGYYAALRRRNRVGRGCRIHRTAVLEGVTLGDGVTVGAHAVVRFAHIGSGTTLEDQCSVTLSVLGPNNYVANKNHIAYSLSYEDVFAIHGPYQFSVFGRRSAVFAVIDCDVRLDGQSIAMPTANGVIDSNRHLLGNAYGHDVKIGGGNIIAPGRVVPNGLHLPPPDIIVYSFDSPH